MHRRTLAAGLAALLFAAGTRAAASHHPHPAHPPHPRKRGPALPPVYGKSAAVRRFADEVALRQQLDRAWILSNVAQARRIEAVRKLVLPAPPGAAKNWAAYRERFVEPKRIAAGVGFWLANGDALRRAEARWGVPPAIVVGIIGVETYFGRVTGNFRVIDSLSTLAFDYPEAAGRDRSDYFRSELEQFLVYCAREHLDPQKPTGSYAGAIGIGQFMPGSINRWAVDFDGSGRIDLGTNTVDAIGSVANYLAQAGWRRGMATHFGVTPPAAASDAETLLAPDIKPAFTPAQFAAHGATLDAAGQSHDGALALVELENGDAAPSWVAGTDNFYAITRYNRSSYYAMAVIDLGEAVRAALP